MNTGSQNLCAPIPNQTYGPRDNFGLTINIFNLFQYAHALAVAAPTAGAYVMSRPTESKLKELRKILKSWRRVLAKLDPEQKAQFELDHPGEFASMLDAIGSYEDRLEDLKVDLRNNPWARYLPRQSQLDQEFQIVAKGIWDLDSEYYTTTKKYRRNQANQATGNPTPPQAPGAAATADDVEMLPIANNDAVEVQEQRIINRATIDQTERYRSILRVYSNYSMPPNMQGTYTAIQDFVTTLLSRPDDTITIMSPV
uniref:Protein kinase domain-containing protein n=1 Tax=Ganoderma boninense TaxID=34458 RepID=A0A5K1K1N5_9APHY|nr:Protein kinase domain-containing protein [Ganoderma boninense]